MFIGTSYLKILYISFIYSIYTVCTVVKRIFIFIFLPVNVDFYAVMQYNDRCIVRANNRGEITDCMVTERIVEFEGKNIYYQFEQKKVKNLNLRVRRDGSVYVSASPRVALKRVDEFVRSNGGFILKAQDRIAKAERERPQPKEYIDGEKFTIMGKGLCLKVIPALKNEVLSDDDNIYLKVKDPEDPALKKRLMDKYFDKRCREVFEKLLIKLYPGAAEYGVPMPEMRMRYMKSRWGSCMPGKGVITLNKYLLSFPEECIEYVIMHELCHFLQADHSKRFYAYLTALMPDWKVRKEDLDNNGIGLRQE